MNPAEAQTLRESLFPPTSESDALGILQLAVREKAVDRYGLALEQSADSPEDLGFRERMLVLLTAIADEVSTYELAATLWRRCASLQGPPRAREAFLSLARAYAYAPEDPTVLEEARSLASRVQRVEAEEAQRWLQTLARDGILARTVCARFDEAIEQAQPPSESARLAAEISQPTSIEEANTLLERIAQEGRTAALFPVLRGESPDFPPGSPQEQRLLYVLQALEARLPPSRERGEVRFLLAVRWQSAGEARLAFRWLARALTEYDQTLGLSLAEEWFRADPDALDEEGIERSCRTAELPDPLTRRLLSLYRSFV